MRKDFLPFSRPSITDAEVSAVTEVMRSGWITTGPKCAEFEKKFAEYTGCPEAVALASATAGMHIALRAMGIGPGDEVITPSMTWVSTINLIVLAGAKPVFADVDRDTLMITRQMIQSLITPKTRLIIPVHFAGAAVEMGPIGELAKMRDIPVLEDAAHAAGTSYKGIRVGTKGTSIFSFHPIKNMTTGEGGMFCSDDPKLVERIKRLKFHGLGIDAFDRQMQGRSPQAEVLEPGFKYNLTDMAAAMGLSQLARLEEMNRKRSELAALYHRQLAEIDEIIPLGMPKYEVNHTWHLFIVRLDIDRADITRDDFMKELKQRNIGTGLHFRAAHLQKYYIQSMGCRRGMLPNTEWNSDRIMSLPLFPDMKPEDVSDVVNTIKEVLKK